MLPLLDPCCQFGDLHGEGAARILDLAEGAEPCADFAAKGQYEDQDGQRPGQTDDELGDRSKPFHGRHTLHRLGEVGLRDRGVDEHSERYH